MTIKLDMDINAFADAVRKCRGEVRYITGDGDRLNLKSILSLYLFSCIANNQDFALQGKVICQDKNDYTLLGDYLQEGLGC